jgi:hypothetical protein
MNKSVRNSLISIFVVCWLFIFHYESLRALYLNPFFKRELPKVKFLFPPAGWIMFFRVDDAASSVEIYGITADNQPQLIDPHDILQTRPIGYDNIHRGALFAFASPDNRGRACAFLRWKLPYFKGFVVTYVQYPSLAAERFRQQRYILYQCE